MAINFVKTEFIATLLLPRGPISLKFQNNCCFMRDIWHWQVIWDSIFSASEVFTSKNKVKLFDFWTHYIPRSSQVGGKSLNFSCLKRRLWAFLSASLSSWCQRYFLEIYHYSIFLLPQIQLWSNVENWLHKWSKVLPRRRPRPDCWIVVRKEEETSCSRSGSGTDRRPSAARSRWPINPPWHNPPSPSTPPPSSSCLFSGEGEH